MKINSAISALENVIALIVDVNAAASGKVTSTSVTVGVPTLVNPPVNGFNASVVVSVAEGSALTGGPVTINYNRRVVTENVITPPTTYTFNGTDTIEVVTAALIAALDLVTAEVTVTGTLPTAQGTSSDFTITAGADSLLYTGTTTISVTWPAETLDEAIAVKNMNGFEVAS